MNTIIFSYECVCCRAEFLSQIFIFIVKKFREIFPEAKGAERQTRSVPFLTFALAIFCPD
jgi:hypothetical protein